MRLSAVARYFDRMPCLDAYSSQFLFFGQLSVYDDSKRDSEAGERRVISMAPDAVIPKRRVVLASGHRYILGTAYPDSFNGSVIRNGFVAHEATELVAIRTLGQACLGTGGLKAWASRAWVKNLADHEQSSDLTPQFHIHFSQTESVIPGSVIVWQKELLIARTSHVGPAGTLIVLADQMPSGSRSTANLSYSTYNRVTETAVVANSTLNVIRGRWQSIYEYQHPGTKKFGPEDLQIAVPKPASVDVGSVFMFTDGTWRVESVQEFPDFNLCWSVKQ